MTNNIHTFTAADIEKYHKGQLTPKEMNALEKAALEDPFLADALEGYNATGINVMADLTGLKNRLGNRIAAEAENKVVPMGATRKPFPWLRAAAAVVIIAGGALLANQFLFNNKKEELAALDKKKEKTETPPATADTGAATATVPATDGIKQMPPNSTTGTTGTKQITNSGETIATDINDEEAKTNNAPVITSAGQREKEIADPKQTITPGTETKAAERADSKNVSPAAGNTDKDLARNQDLKKTAPGTAPPTPANDAEKNKKITATETVSNSQPNRNVTVARKTDDQAFYNQRANVFRGRVTDANNVGVPFANVTNVEDKVGTYTDAYGNFNLTSPDSTLTVQVRSIGFENRQVQLRNNLPNNQVVMQDDRRNIAEVVVSNQKPADVANRRTANKVLQEPEPVDGWSNYNTYAANNLEIPEEIRSKQNTGGTVQVSFEVDKYGEPVNIRVEKSLCTKCDQEAIRLIKDGPKWKRAANKKGRTTVTINF